MRKISFLSFLLCLFLRSAGQAPVGTWSDHLVYSTAVSLAVSEENVYASTGSSILVYNRDLSELRKFSHINGLTETGISAIGWSAENKTLIIAYNSTNLDLVENNTIFNLPDIERKFIPGEKNIRRIRTTGRYAYLACSFGIVVVDLIKKEIFDTWKPGSSTGNTPVYDIALGNGKFFAATEHGVYSGDMNSSGLSYFGNWDLLPNLPDLSGKYTGVLFTGGRLLVNLSSTIQGGDAVYSTGNTGSTLLSFTPGAVTTSIDASYGGFTVSNARGVNYYNSGGILQKSISDYGKGTPAISQGIADGNDIWIADKYNGLVFGRNMTDFSFLTLPGPGSDQVVNISSFNGKTLITRGGITPSWNSLQRPFQVSVNEKNTWSVLSPAGFRDAMRGLIDPVDNSHFFITSWGDGLFEFRGTNWLKI